MLECRSSIFIPLYVSGSPAGSLHRATLRLRAGRQLLAEIIHFWLHRPVPAKRSPHFSASIDQLLCQSLDHTLSDETQVVYVSPLKALSNDIHRNLQEPLAEIQQIATAAGADPQPIRVAVRTGDTPAKERQAMLRKAHAHILVTTPESLYLVLTSAKSREILRNVRTVIVDEIHALARDKRGSHLALSLARLDELCGKRPTRIGLSATQRPIEEIARFLVGSRNDDARWLSRIAKSLIRATFASWI